MKKLIYLIVLTLILGLVLTGCLLSNVGQVPTTGQSGIAYLTKGIEAVPNKYPLYAGQDWLVGEVLVWSDDTQVCVRYELNEGALEEGWLIYETHLAVAASIAGIPVNKSDNPKVGKFPYGYDDIGGEEFYEECIPFGTEEGELDVDCDETLVIAAHAVVEKHEGCNEIGDVYGIERDTGKVWGVDVVTGNTAEIFTTVTPPKTNVGPNGLAYDGLNRRFYYCDYTSTDWLYFWDGTQELVAGLLPGEIADADFDDGKYYFITGPPPSDDLYEVFFNADGTIAGGNTVKLADIANDEHGWTFNGDIAVKDGVVYGWGLCSHGYEFFTYDLATPGTFATVIKTDYKASLQLAFGLDGELYGHRSGGSGEFFVIDTATGEVIVPATCNTGGILFTDCSSGDICEPITETAWAANEEIEPEDEEGTMQFDGANWATYFNYTVECPDCVEQLWQIGTPDGEVNPKIGADEYPANRQYYDEFTYIVGVDGDPIGAPSMPGYIGLKNVCDVNERPLCTDTTKELNIEFELYCSHEEGELVLIYDRYGSETDTLYFDFDGTPFATVVATEGGFKQFNLPLPAAAAGTHTITIAYESGGDANGHYIDYLKLKLK